MSLTAEAVQERRGGAFVVLRADLIEPREPGSHDHGITSRVLIAYNHTPGNLTQYKDFVVQPGGGFDNHDHPDMDELFRFLGGGAMRFTFYRPGEPPQTVELYLSGDSIMFDAGTFHQATNIGVGPAYLLAIGNRTGNRAPQDAGKCPGVAIINMADA